MAMWQSSPRSKIQHSEQKNGQGAPVELRKAHIISQRRGIRGVGRRGAFLALPAVILACLFLSSNQPVRASNAGQMASQEPESSAEASGRVGSTKDLDYPKTLIRQGKFPEAAVSLRSYLREHGDSAKAHVLLGLALFQMNQPAESLGEFSRAAQISPPGASELIVVALDYVKLRDLANADKWMTDVVGKAPTNVSAWRYLGGIKYSENRFDEAIDAYRRCLSLHPEDVIAEDGIARSYEGLSRDDDALAAYHLALEWQSHAGSKFPQPLIHLGGLLVRCGQAEAAVPLLESARALDPGDSDIHEQLGEAYSRLNRLKEAQAELEEAIRLVPANSHLHWLLAAVYRKEGMAEQAEREMRLFSSMIGSHSNDKSQ